MPLPLAAFLLLSPTRRRRPITPAFNHLWIRRGILGSAIRFSMSWTSSACEMLSKKLF